MNIYAALEATKKNKKTPHSTTTAGFEQPDTQVPPVTVIQTADTTPSKPETPKAKPTFEAVTVNIAGTNHRINCPSDEVNNLEIAATYIDDKVRSLRHSFKSKSLSNEELLVLTCLELYDQLTVLQAKQRLDNDEWQQSHMLLNKIIKDAQSIL